jgi:hypothetical protein
MSYFNNRFNTNRFLDVTTETERDRGTSTFCDTEQPGVYYSENSNGRVYRKIRRKVIVQDRLRYTTSEYTDNTTYCINPRVVPRDNMSPDRVLIPSQQGRLNLIQYSADNYNDIAPSISMGRNSEQPGLTFITIPDMI